MWAYNFKAVKLCFSNSRSVLVKNKVFDFKNLFGFLCDVKYVWTLSLESGKFQFVKYCFLEAVRKNHFETRSQKIIVKPVTGYKGKEISHTCLIECLQNCRSVEEQIELFHRMVKLPDDNINIRQSICKDLEKALQPYFLSSVSVSLIGSSINGLGLKGCDVDLSLQFSTRNVNEHLTAEKLLSSDETEKVPVNKVYAAKNQLLTVRKILQELQFKEPLTVIPGRCPILNFSHRNFPCDLSVNNRLALHSTNLMLLCGKLDERVTPLMQVITYWAKNCKIVGGPGKFKTYAIFLLVIYFLQTRSPPVLPAVETMFEKTEFLKNLDNWSYDVTKYLSHFERSLNCQTVEELLKEFFIFYGNYDFSHIICPIKGRSAERKVFSKEIDCNNSFVLNTICIQDPLNLAWNVTTGVSWKHCKSFMKASIVVWEQFQDQSCQTSRDRHWGILALIDYQYMPDSLVNVKEFTIDLPLASVCNSMHKSGPALTEQAENNVKYILSHCLDFDCYPLLPGSGMNTVDLPQNVRSVVENQLMKADLPGSHLASTDISQHLARYICATKDTWLGRNTYSVSLDAVDNVFDRERQISEKIKIQRENNEKEMFYFLCECRYAFVEGKECLQIKFKLLNSDRFIPKLVIFLKDYIPRLMNKLVHEQKK